MAVLLSHLLKWRYQPGRRGRSWRSTIGEQRRALHEILEGSPSLRSYPAQIMDLSQISARLMAADETGIDFTLFPEACPFTVEQILDPDFMPLEPDRIDQNGEP